jgi:hypothetical protein
MLCGTTKDPPTKSCRAQMSRLVAKGQVVQRFSGRISFITEVVCVALWVLPRAMNKLARVARKLLNGILNTVEYTPTRLRL